MTRHGPTNNIMLQLWKENSHHDELVFDAHRDEAEIIKPIIINCMQSALQLPNEVPADAEVGSGENWLEAH